MSQLIITTEAELQRVIESAIEKFLNRMPQSTSQEEPGKKYLSIDEAAKYLSLAKATVYAFTHQREIPFIKRAKRLLFLQSDLDTWLEQGRKKSKSQIRAEIASK